MNNETKTIGSVEQSFDIIETIEELEEAGLSEIASELSMSKSTAYTHLNTLRSGGYLVKEDGIYRLSCQFLRLGATVQNKFDLYRRGKGPVDELADTTGERANLVIEEQGQGICIHAANGQGMVDSAMSLGEQRYMHSTATGKAILAHLPEERVNEIIDQYGLPGFTEATITTRDELNEELAKIRETDVSVDAEEAVTGLRCFASPIVVDATPIGSVSVSGPSRVFSHPEYEEELKEAVRDTANIIQLEFVFS